MFNLASQPLISSLASDCAQIPVFQDEVICVSTGREFTGSIRRAFAAGHLVHLNIPVFKAIA